MHNCIVLNRFGTHLVKFYLGYEKKLNNDNIYQNICNDCKGSPRHKIHSTLKQIKLKHNQSFNITDKLNTTNQKLVNVPVHNICMVPLKNKNSPTGSNIDQDKCDSVNIEQTHLDHNNKQEEERKNHVNYTSNISASGILISN